MSIAILEILLEDAPREALDKNCGYDEEIEGSLSNPSYPENGFYSL